MIRWLTLLLVFNFSLFAQYTMGKGYKVADALTLGAYFSTEYEDTSREQTFVFDDIAFLAYGNLSDHLSYMLELEAVTYYKKNYTTEVEEYNPKFHYERAYLDYKQSDTFNYRIGRQIAPIGYWNLEPINVLRDTSSNPILSKKIFPKFLSGLDVYGYLPSSDTTQYHLFVQETKDLDTEYLNISTDHFVGLSLEHELTMELSLGGTVGEFRTLTDDTTQFFMLNFKHDAHPFITQMEAVVSFTQYKNNSDERKVASYLQSMYKFNEHHAVVVRVEDVNDEQNIIEDDIGILGYSYRPIYPVSLKGEYQWHRDSSLNKLLFSFSVLF